MSRRREDTERGPAVTIDLDGAPIDAYAGESLAAAILAAGGRRFRWTRRGAPRGPFCNMGVCFECVVRVNGARGVRACMTAAEAGMRVETREGADGS